VTFNGSVIHFLETSVCLSLGAEGQISVSERLACSLVEDNLGLLHPVTFAGEELIQVEVVKFLAGEVADVNARESGSVFPNPLCSLASKVLHKLFLNAST